MTSTIDIVAISAVALAIIFEYVPGASDWFNKLPTPQHKRSVMLLLMAATAAGAYVGSCVTPLVPSIECTQAGAWGVARALIVAVAVNQTTHRITKRE